MRSLLDGAADFAAQWSDDVHHSIRTLLTGERFGFYSCVHATDRADRRSRYGTVACLAETLRRGVYGDPGRVSKRDENAETDKLPMRGDAIVAFTSNHDQVGNRPRGDRLPGLISQDLCRVAALLLLTGPLCVSGARRD